ncbi:hypothetical protein DK847_16475 [Aestuariivirga litoralis]|uniref:HNH nuclease domain-containing protein n=1 Tax=Aestuariivirga litoralis TaxID=2650924 RepID=A0A2W2BIV7_9HYPH|nr:HNH endonuclease signature motif containing protein [Aestuariivirga litoralis]PZF75817.1 hypothetical protein DK847_16475 [Aestuariivirga litoralis]
MGRAWSIITLGADRQYGGNRGYDDEPRRLYRYDSNVVNHLQIAQGDLVVIRNSEAAIGVARVVGIQKSSGLKAIQRCPQCGKTNIKERRTVTPRWRCSAGHEFGEPAITEEPVEHYTADFGGTYVDLPSGISKSQLKGIALRPSDQISIEELDPVQLEKLLVPLSNRALDELSSAIMSGVIGPDESSDETEETAYVQSAADQRNKVLREVRARRGQQRFRKGLIRRYGARCQITGCDITDLLEAAHIWPYRGDGDNHPGNGLLLRADIHTLFDLNLIAIDPGDLTIHLDKGIQRSGYQDIHGRTLLVGIRKPSNQALESRWKIWRERQQ